MPPRTGEVSGAAPWLACRPRPEGARISQPPPDLYLEVDAPTPGTRPYLALSMVMAADGAVTVAGRTRQLGGEADSLAFQRMRDRADLVMVGAGTARIESYGRVRIGDDAQRRRTERGQQPVPPLAVVTTGRLEPDARMFDGEPRPVVITTDGADTAALEPVADVLRAGEQRVDLAAAMRLLRERGVEWLQCEGGPRLNRELAAAGLVDELFVTVSPQLVSGRAGLLDGTELDTPRDLELVEHHVVGDEVLLRYRVRQPPADRVG